MSDLNAMASLFFDHPSSREVAAEQAQNSADKPAPPNPSGEPGQANTEAKALNAIYSTEFARDVKLFDPTEALDKPLAEIEEANEQFRDEAWALQMSEPSAAEFATMLRAARVSPPTEEQRAAWQKETGEQLVARYGQAGARERLDVVTQWLKRSPGIAQRIKDAGLIGNPRLAEVATEMAWSAKARGEF